MLHCSLMYNGDTLIKCNVYSFICPMAQKEACRQYHPFNRPLLQWKNIDLFKIIIFQTCQDMYLYDRKCRKHYCQQCKI